MEFGTVQLWTFRTALIIILYFSSVSTSNTSERVCFKILGCFDMEEPWNSLLRPIPAPMTPTEINTRIYFYSRPEVDKRYEILLHPEVDLNGAPLNRSLPTAIITHGFASNGNSSWLSDIKDAYLDRVDGNVMLVDWGKGSSLFNYLQVSGNTRVVGAELARMVKELKIDPSKLHFIGHSLGSHISAYAAQATPNTARITALDPAQPAFEGFHQDVRLDPSDAVFVDVIHSDARPLIPTLGFGMMTPAGHVDFYMNGGFDQPGCIIPKLKPNITSLLDLAKYPVEVIGDMVACPHGRAYEYFLEALRSKNNCTFWGHQAKLTEWAKVITHTLTQGFFSKVTALSSQCTKSDCTPLGLHTKASPLRGAFVTTTKGSEPFCLPEPDPVDSKPGIIGKVTSVFG